MGMQDFKVIGNLGKGAFAAVTKVQRRSDGKTYALKRVNISKMKQAEVADTLNEIRFLASIKHPYVVGFLEAFLDRGDTELCIIMEYCSYGDLAEKVERYKKRRQHIDEKVIWAYLIQCLEALAHLHAKKICHRDLKPANCFLCDDGTIKIGDMNVSKRMKHGLLKTQIGTPYYMSPEIWSNKPYNESSDMWALGCLVYELCALHPPFMGDSFPQLKRAVLQGRYKSIPRCYSYEMSTVLSKLMRVNSRSRPSAKDLLSSPEVQKYMKPGGYGSVAPESHRPIDLMETIKVPHGPKRRISAALPKPCYPDARPKSPEAWPITARDRKNAINQKNGGGLESVSEDVPAKPKIAQSPLPIKAKGGAADIVKNARQQAAKPSSKREQPETKDRRKALAPIDRNEKPAAKDPVKKSNRPPRPNNSHQAGARPSAAQYKQADRSNFNVKPQRPGAKPSGGGAGGRRPQGYSRANGYRNAANAYGQAGGGGGGGGQPNYRRGQYSYKPSWWG
ncbi:hypothetical protein TL16_g02037 [Triparma laevis f. inornata]|uniref:non-specific serine/threonine protein kinase n=1 Tax=Triparma laevis f. inornata TaxID=1714386 RepID=A0A9W6ZRE0_9STRA|nr:hypothetical protein TL16_g02037 [Triparma laevis f. inornata]